MGMTVQIHPTEFRVTPFTGFVVVKAMEGGEGGAVSVFLPDAAAADELIKAAVEAKRLLSPPEPEHDHDADLPWTTAHKFIPCTTCSEDACNACGRPKASYVHVLEGKITAKPADAPYAEKLTAPAAPARLCRAKNPSTKAACVRLAGHRGGHVTASGAYWRDVPEPDETPEPKDAPNAEVIYPIGVDPFGPDAYKYHNPGCVCPDCQAAREPAASRS